MSEFQYVAQSGAGQRVSGTLTANTEREVLQALGDKGLLPLKIEPAKERRRRGGRKLSGRIMANFYRQLSDLLRSGVSLLRALELLERQASDGDLPTALGEIRRAVADGDGLAESMAKYPHLFRELAVSMIRAGQEGGFLEDVLARIADYTEQEEELKSRVTGAMAYPIFLFVIGSSVITILLIFFVPKFEQMFERLADKGQLPQLTVLLLAVSDFLQKYGILLLAAVAGAFYGVSQWKSTPQGREKFDRFKLYVPRVGGIIRDFAIVRFSRILGTMLSNGIPILSALRIAKDSCGNVVLSKAIADAADNVTTGESLTEPLRQSGFFPRDVVEMVSIAEESNNLEKVLLDISESLERKTTRQLELFVRLLEPMMLLVMAGITLVVVAALLLPVLKMSSALK